MSAMNIQLENFSGPLGLLLYLIRKDEMDILDINIHRITQAYLDSIKALPQLNLESAGDFVAMAATLIHIKSRMLLPDSNADGVDGDAADAAVDPRTDLVRKLLEYERIKEASQDLKERVWLGRDVWSRGQPQSHVIEASESLVVDDQPLFSLISAYRFVEKKFRRAVHRVGIELKSVAERIMELRWLLPVGSRKSFFEITASHPGETLITFLSCLELGKMGFVRLFQTEPMADIWIEAQQEISGDIVSQVENYDSVDGADLRAQLFRAQDPVSN